MSGSAYDGLQRWRVTIRVRPGAGRTVVGGSHADALVVRVRVRAVDGKATLAALSALATALRVRTGEVALVGAASSRTKVVDIPEAAIAVFKRLRISGRLVPVQSRTGL